MSEWKPGDVALVQMGDGPTLAIFTGEFWAWSDGNGPFEGVSHCHRDVPAHRAVVIDPTDREQVERLSEHIRDAEQSHGQDFWEYDQVALTAALREFADPMPPKPAEPLGLGAVVEDSEGDIWLRDGMPGDRSQSGHWWNKTVAHEKNYDGVLRADWHAIAAVRVLSPGVTDEAGGAS